VSIVTFSSNRVLVHIRRSEGRFCW